MLLKLIWTRCTAPRLPGTVVRWLASARGHPGKQTTEFDIHKIRNIGIMAHIDAGKTTTTERMLFYSGITRHLGNVDDGDTVMDYMEQERDRGITITAAAITFFWKKHKINLIDTPGHIDFTLEVERALRVLDGAVAVLDASAGVEAQTLTVWRRADHYSIPRIIYINKMDKTGADFDKSLYSVSEKLKVIPLVTQLPLGQQKDFTGIIDVIGLRKILWDAKSEGKNYIEFPLHPEKDGLFYGKAVTARTKLVEQLADIDDTIAEYVLSDVDYSEIPDNTIHVALRQATLRQTGVPVLCGSSLRNKGVQPLLDAITQYLPDPSHREYEFVEYYKDTMCALAFKITHDKQRGSLTFLRMYSGSLDSTSSVYNVSRDCSEKVGRLLQVSADEYKELQTVTQGNIVAVSGLKQTVTGDTLVTNQKAARAAQKAKSRAVAGTAKVLSTDTQAEDVSETSSDTDSIDTPILAGIEIPEPVFFCSVEPPSQAFQADMEQALGCLSREDPSLRVSYDEETGQNVLSGMGELHLDIIKDRLLKEYKLEVDLGPLQVSYREALIASTAHTLTLDRLIGDRQHSVYISLSLCPSPQPPQKHINLQPDKDVDFSRLRRHILQALDSGMRSGLSRGPILGFPVVNTEVNLHSLVVGRGTSTSFVTAAVAQCIAEALQKGSVDLLEPVMNLEITTEESHVGTVIADLGRRRGMVSEVQAHQDSRIVIARTPLSEMIGYATTLRTFTSGTASFIMELADYETMSAQEQQKAIQKVTGFIPL